MLSSQLKESQSELETLIKIFAKMPGLGPRSAQRLVFHLIKKREIILNQLISSLENINNKIKNLIYSNDATYMVVKDEYKIISRNVYFDRNLNRIFSNEKTSIEDNDQQHIFHTHNYYCHMLDHILHFYFFCCEPCIFSNLAHCIAQLDHCNHPHSNNVRVAMHDCPLGKLHVMDN